MIIIQVREMVAWNWMLTAEMGRSGHIHNSTIYVRAGFPGGQMVKNLPSVWETGVRSLDWEDPLEEDMATHSSILDWRMPTDRGVWWAIVSGLAESDMTGRLSTAHVPAGSERTGEIIGSRP